MSIKLINTARRVLFTLLLALLLAALIRGSWFADRPRATALPGAEENLLEDRVFLFQSKLIAGSHLYMQRHSDSASGGEKLLGEVVPQLFDDLRTAQMEDPKDPQMTRAKLLLLARYIGNESAADSLQGGIIVAEIEAGKVKPAAEVSSPAGIISSPDITPSSPNTTVYPPDNTAPPDAAMPSAQEIEADVAAPDIQKTDQLSALYRSVILDTLRRGAPDNSVELTVESRDWLRRKLDWFGLVFVSYFDKDPAVRDKAAAESRDQATYAFEKLVVLATGGSIFVVTALLSFIYLLSRWYFGKIVSAPVELEVDRDLLLETFTLYLAAMYFLPDLVLRLGPFMTEHKIQIEPMAFNIVAILMIGLVILWPRLWGAARGALRRTIGLKFSTIGKFLRDLIIAPFTYAAAWVPLSLLMIIFSLTLRYFDIDTSSGTHPIVPFLVESTNPMVLIRAIILAVVIAPLIEELLFRGVFYSWLRSRFSAGASIIISALIFASVHPQGAIGLLPLTYIGCVLAFLREWRGNLLSSMIAHACFNGGTMALLLFFFK